MRQITCFENGQPFEYVRTQYVGNRFGILFRKIRQEIENYIDQMKDKSES